MDRSASALTGRRILVTRPVGQSGELAAEILKRGGEPILFPVITIEDPESWTGCDEALSRIGRYNAVAVTSANAAERFLRRAAFLGVSISSPQWYVVGDATRRMVQNHGIAIAGRAKDATAESLARFLSGTEIKGKRLLLPQGNRARPVLRRMIEQEGGQVDTVVVYRTIDATPESVDAVRQMLADRKIDVLTFASPSAVQRFFRLIRSRGLLRENPPLQIAAIGRTTAEAVAAEGFVAGIVAPRATARDLAAAIEHYYQKSNDE